MVSRAAGERRAVEQLIGSGEEALDEGFVVSESYSPRQRTPPGVLATTGMCADAPGGGVAAYCEHWRLFRGNVTNDLLRSTAPSLPMS